MPPQYKFYEPTPATPHSMGLLEKLSNSRPGDYNAQYNEALRAKQALEAQGLNNQSVRLSVEAKQRQAAQEKAQAEALVAQFGGANAGQPFDGDAALQTAQRIAAQSGDLNSMLAIEKATRDRENDTPITPEQAKEFNVPANTTRGMLHAYLRAREQQGLTDRYNDPAKKKKRYYDAILAEQNARGTRRSQLPAVERAKVQSAMMAATSIEKVRSLIPEVDTGVLNALKSGGLTGLYKDPESVSYRLAGQLNKLKKEVARMNDSGALTALDVEMFAPLTAGSEVYNSKESLTTAMDDLMEYINARREITLTTNEAAGVNVDYYRTGEMPEDVPLYEDASRDPNAIAQQYAGQPNPQPTPSGPPIPQEMLQMVPENPDGTPLTPEQFKALKNRGR